MKLSIQEIKNELREEFSFICGYDLVRLYDYIHKTSFSKKVSRSSVNENKNLNGRLRMLVSAILESADPSDLIDIYQF